MDISQNRGGLDGGVSGLRLCDVRLPRNGGTGIPGSREAMAEPLRMS